jgi:hypothetical protein
MQRVTPELQRLNFNSNGSIYINSNANYTRSDSIYKCNRSSCRRSAPISACNIPNFDCHVPISIKSAVPRTCSEPAPRYNRPFPVAAYLFAFSNII